MKKYINKVFLPRIPSDSSVNNTKVSLIFRHFVTSPGSKPLKIPRLKIRTKQPHKNGFPVSTVTPVAERFCPQNW